MTGIDANKCELSDERIGHDLEGQRRKRLAVISFAMKNLLRMIGIRTFGRENIVRRGQIVDDCIEQRLHAFVLESSSAENREELQIDHAAAQRSEQFLG